MSNQREKKADLRRKIYLSCRQLSTIDAPDVIKDIRDDIASQLFGKLEKDLTNSERVRMLNYLNNANGVKNIYCSRRQANTVRNLAFEYGVFYHDFSQLRIINAVGEVMSPDDIKTMIQEEYINKGFKGLRSKYKQAIWTQTANQKCNELLVTSGFRPNVGDPSVFYYEKMSRDEADYLIKRFLKLNYKVKEHHQLGMQNQISNN